MHFLFLFLSLSHHEIRQDSSRSQNSMLITSTRPFYSLMRLHKRTDEEIKPGQAEIDNDK